MQIVLSTGTSDVKLAHLVSCDSTCYRTYIYSLHLSILDYFLNVKGRMNGWVALVTSEFFLRHSSSWKSVIIYSAADVLLQECTFQSQIQYLKHLVVGDRNIERNLEILLFYRVVVNIQWTEFIFVLNFNEVEVRIWNVTTCQLSLQLNFIIHLCQSKAMFTLLRVLLDASHFGIKLFLVNILPTLVYCHIFSSPNFVPIVSFKHLYCFADTRQWRSP